MLLQIISHQQSARKRARSTSFRLFENKRRTMDVVALVADTHTALPSIAWSSLCNINCKSSVCTCCLNQHSKHNPRMGMRQNVLKMHAKVWRNLQARANVLMVKGQCDEHTVPSRMKGKPFFAILPRPCVARSKYSLPERQMTNDSRMQSLDRKSK